MKNIIMALPLILAAILTQAQSIQRSVVGSAGKVNTIGAYKLSYTVGEAITKKVSASGLSINQGFQQNNIASTPLPISGLEFTAVQLNNTGVQLTWKTAQELNNKGFYIERQLDNESDFTTQNFVASKADGGNSSIALNYAFTDMNSYSGYSYYRLKQEDLDGKFIYSLIRSVKGEASTITNMQVWPVPATEVVHVKIEGLPKDDQILVLDMSGKIVQQLPIRVHATVQLSNLLPGFYIVRLASDKTMCQKIVVQ